MLILRVPPRLLDGTMHTAVSGGGIPEGYFMLGFDLEQKPGSLLESHSFCRSAGLLWMSRPFSE